MKLVVQTQIRENYGAHDWDGEGECPQYWKFKGGSTYVAPELTFADMDDVHTLVRDVERYVTEMNDSFQEYVIDWEIVDNDEIRWEKWESPTILQFGDEVVATRTVNNRGEYGGYYRREIAEKRESWIMLEGNGRKEGSYQCEYTMVNGDIVEGEDALRSWYDMREDA